jgi:hypothetical protein
MEKMEERWLNKKKEKRTRPPGRNKFYVSFPIPASIALLSPFLSFVHPATADRSLFAFLHPIT